MAGGAITLWPCQMDADAGAEMSTTRSILDHVYDHEANCPDQVFLTQPIGGGQVVAGELVVVHWFASRSNALIRIYVR